MIYLRSGETLYKISNRIKLKLILENLNFKITRDTPKGNIIRASCDKEAIRIFLTQLVQESRSIISNSKSDLDLLTKLENKFNLYIKNFREKNVELFI